MTSTRSPRSRVVNRDQPRLFINYVVESGIEIDTYWWNRYRRPGEWLHGRDTVVYDDVVALVEAYEKEIEGVVLYDSEVASTSNVASAVAGIENLIAIRYDTSPNSLYGRLVLNGPRLKVKVRLINEDGTPLFNGKGTIPGTERVSTGSVKNDPYIWFIEHYMKTDRCNGSLARLYRPKWREPAATDESPYAHQPRLLCKPAGLFLRSLPEMSRPRTTPPRW